MRMRLAHWSQLIPVIAAFEPELIELSDSELRKRSLSLKYRARSRNRSRSLLPEAFALVREAGRRTLNMRHFDVQMLGGIAMHHRSIAEMQTGEGKTLTATLPLYLGGAGRQGRPPGHGQRLPGPPRRRLDAADLSSAGHDGRRDRIARCRKPARREAYACDVTYGTAKEFGFDFLRDRLLLRRIGEGHDRLAGRHARPRRRAAARSRCSGRPFRAGRRGRQHSDRRSPHAADHQRPADRGRADRGRVPSLEPPRPCRNSSEDEHYEYDHEKQTVELTADGRQLVRALPKPRGAAIAVGMFTIYEYIERAIKVDREYSRSIGNTSSATARS